MAAATDRMPHEWDDPNDPERCNACGCTYLDSGHHSREGEECHALLRAALNAASAQGRARALGLASVDAVAALSARLDALESLSGEHAAFNDVTEDLCNDYLKRIQALEARVTAIGAAVNGNTRTLGHVDHGLDASYEELTGRLKALEALHPSVKS